MGPATDQRIPNGYEERAGLADFALELEDRTITFVSGDLKVTLSVAPGVSEQIDLDSVAVAYARWLSGDG